MAVSRENLAKKVNELEEKVGVQNAQITHLNNWFTDFTRVTQDRYYNILIITTDIRNKVNRLEGELREMRKEFSERFRSQEEQLRSQEEQLRSQGEQLRSQGEQLKEIKEMLKRLLSQS